MKDLDIPNCISSQFLEGGICRKHTIKDQVKGNYFLHDTKMKKLTVMMLVSPILRSQVNIVLLLFECLLAVVYRRVHGN